MTPVELLRSEAAASAAQKSEGRTMRVHVVSIHWATSEWIELQQAQLARHLAGVPTCLYQGVGGGISPTDPAIGNWKGFDHFEAVPVDGRHAQNLDKVIEYARPSHPEGDDVLLVLDQDAFPTRPLAPLIEQSLRTGEPIAAVRTENNGDEQPHPLFAMMPFSLWHDLRATWEEGPVRLGKQVGRKDVGGVLLRQLRDAGQDWVRLSRSADTGEHAVLYGVYGDVVYHHGAASRPVWTDADARRIYRNLAHRALDGAFYRVATTRPRTLRHKEQVRMAVGHRHRTEQLMRDPDAFVSRLSPVG